MTTQEKLQHETIKASLKQAIQNNPNLTPDQKQIVCDNIDRAALQVDWILEIAQMCGWMK